MYSDCVRLHQLTTRDFVNIVFVRKTSYCENTRCPAPEIAY